MTAEQRKQVDMLLRESRVLNLTATYLGLLYERGEVRIHRRIELSRRPGEILPSRSSIDIQVYKLEPGADPMFLARRLAEAREDGTL